MAGVSHRFGRFQALDDVSFTVPRGAFAALLGVNGAGKTTLFSLITRLYTRPRGGSRWRASTRGGSRARRLARLGVVFQSRALDGDLTLRQNLTYHAALQGLGGRAAKTRIGEVLALVGLAERGGVKANALSGGQQRRAEIARALLHRPELLLLDEATAGLDLRARAEVQALVRRLIAEEGVSTLWATHVFDEVAPGDEVGDPAPGRGARGRHGGGDRGGGDARGAVPRDDRAGRGGDRGMRAGWGTAFAGITRREALRFANQRERFLAALVRPLVWLFIFAAGFRSVLGLSITPPYQTYVLYEVYVTPGLCGMILLFSGMQSSLSMVYDRETGAMRTLLVSPYPRWFLLGSKLVASVLVSVLQVYAFLVIAWFWGVRGAALGLCDGAAGAGDGRGSCWARSGF